MPFCPASQAVLDRCDELAFDLFIAWHGLATVFYITAKKQDEAYATTMIRSLLSWATVSTVGHDEARDALSFGSATTKTLCKPPQQRLLRPRGSSHATRSDSLEVPCRSSVLTIFSRSLERQQTPRPSSHAERDRHASLLQLRPSQARSLAFPCPVLTTHPQHTAAPVRCRDAASSKSGR